MNQYRKDVPDGDFRCRMTAEAGGVIFGFEWHGGAYMEVCRGKDFAHPKEVINMWDIEEDGPAIPRTIPAMKNYIHEWIAEYGEEALVHDAHYNW